MESKCLRIFISYSTKDRALAGRLSEELESYGFRVFLAHHDLRPSEKWQQTIVQELQQCNLFLPVLTKHFHGSSWTDQEVGYALSLEKSISPIRVDVEPYGFLNSRQAFAMNRKNVKKRCREFVRQLLRRGNDLKKLTVQSVINKYARSESFNETKRLLEFLIECDPLTKQEVKRIRQAGKENDQIYNYAGLSTRLEWIARKSINRG